MIKSNTSELSSFRTCIACMALIEEKEPPKNSMETIDDLFHSVKELQRIVTPKLMKLNIEQEQVPS